MDEVDEVMEAKADLRRKYSNDEEEEEFEREEEREPWIDWNDLD